VGYDKFSGKMRENGSTSSQRGRPSVSTTIATDCIGVLETRVDLNLNRDRLRHAPVHY
jgi:hypothetical protein